MPNHIVYLTKKFKKEFKKLSSANQQKVMDTVVALREDPFYPSLRTKKMRGKNRDYECSVNMDIRIIWRYKDGFLIILLDVGHHDVLKKY
ncbi:MAG: hypothetical protein LBC70_02390 [Chitinispirillales bacterium]|nr:hypothetical protein [Chitinispirillales bacterium]